MKTNTFYKAIGGLALALFLSSSLLAQQGAVGSSDKKVEEDLKSKEISQETSIAAGADIIIENNGRPIEIKTWEQPKVKITTTLYYQGEGKLTDEEWFEKLGISLKTLGSSVRIKSGNIGSSSVIYNSGGGYGYTTNSNMGISLFDGSGQNIGTKISKKRAIIIYIPRSGKLDIESKYADVKFSSDIADAQVDITSGNLETQAVEKLRLRSHYSNFNGGNLGTTEIEFNNGRFSVKNVDDLVIESSYSSVDVGMAKKSNIRSTSDEYEIDEIGAAKVKKNYGNLRISRLSGSLEVDGTNADVKIRNIEPSVTMIKFDDKYANLRLPAENLKNYSVDFTGAFSKVYAGFEKKVIEEKVSEKTVSDKPAGALAPASGTVIYDGGSRIHVEGAAAAAPRAGTYTTNTLSATAIGGGFRTSWTNDADNPAKFTASVGDGHGPKFDLKCQNCTVDFK